jgi:CelD/BcsL family acetyltransferase involved in cellulose biosynthesis
METYRSRERATLVRREEAGYHEGMRAHHRRELRRLRRGLERLVGAVPTTREVSSDPVASERFLALERASWKGRAGTAFASSPRHAEFFRTVCERFADAGRLELLAFEAGDRTLAMKCNLLAGEAVFCFKIAFDEEFARFSPGLQLELDNVERFHEGSAAWMDSCAAPDHPMINRLWPDRRRIQTVLLPSPGAVGRVSRCGARMARAWRTRERRPTWARS